MRMRYTCLVVLQALKPAAYRGSKREARQEATARVSVGKIERKVFPLRASCYYSASGAEQREMSVLCLWDLTQNIMYTHAYADTHTHTRALAETGSGISMR